MNYQKICINKYLGRCPDCQIDYSNHHPNNIDCPNYKQTTIMNIVVMPKSKLEELSRK